MTKKTKKLDRCQKKIRYGYKDIFQRCLFSYILDGEVSEIHKNK